MKTFEDKLRQSAQRIARNENDSLHTPTRPQIGSHGYWGWIATPVAAIAGVLLGMFIPALTGSADEKLSASADTIRIVKPVHDTLYRTQVVEKERIVEKIVWKERTTKPMNATEQTKKTDVPACSSVSCDGINYAMLVSN